jgi:UDPglucose 6-dehydrogenase
MRVAVVGCGRVGLVTAVGLARAGNVVIGVETDRQRLQELRRSVPPFHEPGVAELLPQLARSGRLGFTENYHHIAHTAIVMISVGTPSRTDGSINLAFIKRAVSAIAAVRASGKSNQVLVVRSTVIPGTTEAVLVPLLLRSEGTARKSLGVVVNPEFMREGRGLEDFLHPDRIVIGELNRADGDAVAKMYRPFKAPIVRTSPTAAETIKYASNALLATLISFSNQMAQLCEAVPGVDVEEVLEAVHLDRRLCPQVGRRLVRPPILDYLRAGCGFGGSCLPKDLRALIAFARDAGVPVELFESVNSINARQPLRLVELAQSAAGRLKKKHVLLLGLSYKPGTDDIRESPGMAIAHALLRRGADLEVHDPLVKPQQIVDLLDRGARFVVNLEKALARADLCILTTGAPEYRLVEKYLGVSRRRRLSIVDGRRLLSSDKIELKGRHFTMGRRNNQSARTKQVDAHRALP